MQSLGYVAQSKRRIKPSNQYNNLFGAPSGLVKNLKKNPSVAEILAHMQILVNSTLSQTVRFAQYLNQNSNGNKELLFKNLFSFIYNHIDYREDDKGFEQLREPARLFLDKVGDCDCYSIFIKSVLQNLGIKSHFKVVKFNNSANYSHVYIVVPKTAGANMNVRSNYWVIDPVLDTFNLEAPGITGSDLAGLSGVAGSSHLSGTSLPKENQSSIYDKLFHDGNLGAVTSVKTAGGSTIKRYDDVNTDNPNNTSTDKLKSPVIYGEGLNPFEQIIALTFKGTRFEQSALNNLAKRINGINGIDEELNLLDPLDPKNLDTVLNSNEVKKYTKDIDATLNSLNLPETKKAIAEINKLKAYVKTNKQDPKASDIANSPTPIKDFANSQVGKEILGGAALAITGGIVLAVTSTAAYGTLVASLATLGVSTGGVGLVVAAAVAAVVAGVLYLFTDNADETIGNFIKWLGGGAPSIMPFDNYEGFKDDKTDVNVYGDLIREWRNRATGSTSGSDTMQNPSDYFPILISIYQNAPLEPNSQFIVNPEKLGLHAQYQTALAQLWGAEFWKLPNWMRIRAYMCSPLLAEILYGETWESYKPKLQVLFMGKNIPVNFQIIDAEYLKELKNTLKLQLLIAKRDQIAYDNANNPKNTTINTTDPAKNGAIVWIGGQYGGTKTGFQTNQSNLALKAGDKVFIQIPIGAGAVYTGIRTIHSLGTDDGQYKENMFVIDMPMVAGAQNSTGVFSFQEPEGNNDSGGGGLAKLALVGAGIKILTTIL